MQESTALWSDDDWPELAPATSERPDTVPADAVPTDAVPTDAVPTGFDRPLALVADASGANAPGADASGANVPGANVPGANVHWADRLAVFDLETTGIDIDTCRIVTAHVGVIGRSGEVLERREWLVDPGVEIPTAASLIHGVTTERARAEGAPAAQAVAEIIAALHDAACRGLPIVAYNASYDLSVLAREAERYGHDPLPGPGPVIDPLVIDKAVDRYRRGKRTLTAACAHYGVELTDAHDAGADAVAAGRVAQAIVRAFPEVASAAIADLHARQVGWCRDQAESYQSWRRANGEPEFTTSGLWPVR
ncbi:exonuclease domain-containing protein [Agromyces silvae]|uniref:exonuclease domain-containing protein n=1 Tax=Agromyces silvae TaxID=3388266 RepID=UPI00280BE721|nr:exonuclease domain-containing protein [Agromyces protaetiae]